MVRVGIGFALILSGGLAASPAARADDVVARGLPAGGLSLTYNSGVAVASQRLSISRDKVEATYAFQASAAPTTTLMAFQAPRLSSAVPDGVDALPGDDAVDFMALAVAIDGNELRPTATQRASVLGFDITDRLKQDGVPLNPYPLQAGRDALGKLPAAKRYFYVENGLAQWTAEGEAASVQWDVDTSFYWLQAFAPGKPLKVELRYLPASGTTILMSDDAQAPGRLDALAREFCLSPDAREKIASSLKSKALARPKSSDEPGPALLLTRVDYDLSADEWAGVIPDFELLVARPEPGGTVGYCVPGSPAVERTDAQGVRIRNFMPRGMLSVLYAGAAVTP